MLLNVFKYYLGKLYVTRLIKLSPQNLNEVLNQVASILRNGGLAVVPTETVYGLAAYAYNDYAVDKVYEVKRRPRTSPIIVLTDSLESAHELAVIPREYEELLRQFWPGPLTAILHRAEKSPQKLCKDDTIAIRISSHEFILKLTEKVGPITGPSANISGKPSPTKITHVIEDLWGKVDIMVEDDDSLLGIESTIVDFTKKPPVLVRPGILPIEDLAKFLKVEIPESVKFNITEKYRPQTPLILIECQNYDEMINLLVSECLRYLRYGKSVTLLISEETYNEIKHSFENFKKVKFLILGRREEMISIAKNLFHKLRILDKLNSDLGIVESFKERGLGLAITYRLRHASTRIIKC